MNGFLNVIFQTYYVFNTEAHGPYTIEITTIYFVLILRKINEDLLERMNGFIHADPTYIL